MTLESLVSTINTMPEITLEPKYQVKRLDNSEILKPNEYFVLRKQDMLALHTLWNYVSNLRLAYELTLHEEDAQKMLDLADKVSSMAMNWQMDDRESKLPD